MALGDEVTCRPIEQREAAGDQHRVEIGVAQEEPRRLDDVRAERDGADDTVGPELRERRICAVDRLRQVILGIVDVDDVDPVETETLHARFQLAQRRIPAEVEHRVGAILRLWRRDERAAGLGRDDHVVTTDRRQRPAEAGLGFPEPVQRRRVEQPDASFDGSRGSRDGVGLVVAPEDRCQRRGPEPEAGDRETGSSQRDPFELLVHRVLRASQCAVRGRR